MAPGPIAALAALAGFALGWYARRLFLSLSRRSTSAIAGQGTIGGVARYTVALEQPALVGELPHLYEMLYTGPDAAFAKRIYRGAPKSRWPGAHVVLRQGEIERGRRLAGELA